MTTLPASPRQRRPRWRRVLGWTALGLAVLLLVAVGVVVIAARHLESNITVLKPHILGSQPAKIATKAENFLLIGSDTRAGPGDSEGTGSTKDIGGARSDTTILLHISAGDSKATLISIPRDSYVQIPSCLEPNGQRSTPTMDKFNAAFSIGGPSCTIETVQDLTHVKIDHYAVVDFAGFKRIVSALGGVRMCITQPLKDPVVGYPGNYHGSGLDLPAGNSVEIDGQQALDLMRARYGVGDGSDISRIKRQQTFIGAVIRKATSTGLLIDPPKLYRFLDATTKSLTTDGFGIGTMKKLASALHGVGPGRVQILTVPLASSLAPGVPTADVQWDPVKAPELWTAIRKDEPIPGTSGSTPSSPSTHPTPSSTTAPLTVPPSDISIRVLNGSGVSGAAAKAAAALAAEGFHAVVAGDASASTYTSTVVQYGSSKLQSSQTTQAAIPGSKRELDSSLGSTLTVIVGSSYTGVKPVTVATSQSATPTPSPTASIAVTTAGQEGCLS